MNGQNLVDLITSILGGESPNPAYLLQLINLSRLKYESMRPWKVLVSVDTTQTVTGSNTYTTPKSLPTDFYRYLGESSLVQGSIVLFDGSNNVYYLTEVPFENILQYKNSFGFFAVDYSNSIFYITGVVPGTFTIYQYYIKRTVAITLTTTWQKFPSDYAPILAFDSAARFRLGTDYDDINARNADDNTKMAQDIFKAMSLWDNELAISSVNSIDYPNVDFNRGINGAGPRGVRI